MLIGEYDYEMDMAVQREEAAEKAAREATKEAEARATKQVEATAQALKEMGVSADIISKAMGFSASEIASW